jgi:hypothetical protein
MPFCIKNGPPTFQRAINTTFKEYLKPVYEDIFR